MFFRKRKTLRRCRTLSSYAHEIDGAFVDRMAAFLLEDKRNTIHLSREYLMFVTAAGAIVYTMPITPARDDFNAVVISSSWARVQGPYQGVDNGGVGSNIYDGDDRDHDGDGGVWSDFSDSDGSSFTNNNNNNNNNNNG